MWVQVPSQEAGIKKGEQPVYKVNRTFHLTNPSLVYISVFRADSC